MPELAAQPCDVRLFFSKNTPKAQLYYELASFKMNIQMQKDFQ